MDPPLVFRKKNTEVIHVRGDDFEFLDGDNIYFTAKSNPDNDSTDSRAIITKAWVVGDSALIDDAGYLLLWLDDSDTDKDFGDYFYDVKIKRDGSKPLSETIGFGPLKILQAITLRA
jgi:hypothetical protein